MDQKNDGILTNSHDGPMGPSFKEIEDFEVPAVFRTWPKCLLKVFKCYLFCHTYFTSFKVGFHVKVACLIGSGSGQGLSAK